MDVVRARKIDRDDFAAERNAAFDTADRYLAGAFEAFGSRQAASVIPRTIHG